MSQGAERPLKVALLLDTDGFAGTEQYLLTLAREMTAQGACPIVLCRPDTPLHQAAQSQKLNVLPILNAISPFRAAPALADKLRGQGIDLLHAHNGRTSLLAALTGRRLRVPALLTQHFLAPQFTTYSGHRRVVAGLAHRWVNGQLAHVIAISDAAQTAMIAREHLPTGKVTTVWNGIAPPIMPDAARLASVRQEMGAPAGQPLIVTAARLVPEKGISYLLQAVALLRPNWPDARFVIAGEGEEKDRLIQEARRLGIDASVLFTGFRTDVADLIAACDLFVLPSPAEPFGLVLLEAMALGRPVVATRAGGPLEIVNDGKTGLLVAPADPAALAKGIAQMLTDAAGAASMGQAGRARFEQRFTARRMAQETLAVYAQVLQTR